MTRVRNIVIVLVIGGIALYTFMGNSSSSSDIPARGKLRDIEVASKKLNQNQIKDSDPMHVERMGLHNNNGNKHTKTSGSSTKAKVTPDTKQHQNVVHGGSHRKSDNTNKNNGPSHGRSNGQDNKQHVSKNEHDAKIHHGIHGGDRHGSAREKMSERHEENKEQKHPSKEQKGAKNTKQRSDHRKDEHHSSKLPEISSKAPEEVETDKDKHESVDDKAGDHDEGKNKQHIGSKESAPDHHELPPGMDENVEQADKVIELEPNRSVPPESNTVKDSKKAETSFNSSVPLAMTTSPVVTNISSSKDLLETSSNNKTIAGAVSLKTNTSTATDNTSQEITLSTNTSKTSTNLSSSTELNGGADKNKTSHDGASQKADGEDKALEAVHEEDHALEVIPDEKKLPLHGPANKGEKAPWEEAADENFHPLVKSGSSAVDKDEAKHTTPTSKTDSKKTKVEGWLNAEMENFEPIHNKDGDKSSDEEQKGETIKDPSHEQIDLDAQDEKNGKVKTERKLSESATAQKGHTSKEDSKEGKQNTSTSPVDLLQGGKME